MTNIELAKFVSDYIGASREVIEEAFEEDDMSIIEDDVYEYIANCD